MSDSVLRIGSRSSTMALAQVERVRAELAAALPGLTVEFVPVTTSGDTWTGKLSALGGKGAFTKELDVQLIEGRFDLAIHCLKDIPGDRPTPAGTTIAAYLHRDDPRDALVHPAGLTFDQLPPGTRLGTSSVRRSAQIAYHWPHLQTALIRGNADTRLAKMDKGEYDAVILAVAGLHRIGAAGRITEILNTDLMVPSVGAGILALQCREDDQATIEIAGQLGDPHTWREATAERIMLHALQGNCHSPIAGYARTEPDSRLSLHGRVISADGKTVIDAHEWGTDPVALGTMIAGQLLAKGARDIIATTHDA